MGLRPLDPIFQEEKRTGAIQVGNSPGTFQACFEWSVGGSLAEIDFDATCSVAPPDMTIVAWEWDFGDTNTSTSGPTVTHTYSAGGIYTVKLRVQTDMGVWSTLFIKLVSVAQPPMVNLELWLPIMSNPASVTQGGGLATALADHSGNGRDYSGLADWGTRSINGHTVLDFPGNINGYGFTPDSSWSLAAGYTFAGIFQCTGTSGERKIFASNAGFAPGFGQVSGTGPSLGSIGRFGVSPPANHNLTDGNDGNAHIWVIYNAPSGTNTSWLRVDGVLEDTADGSSGFNITTSHMIGQVGSNNHRMQGGIGELLIYSGEVTGTDLADLENFLAAI